MRLKYLLLALLLLVSAFSFAQKVAEPAFRKPEWTRPFPPFRIVGNLYYVGTEDLACFLIVSGQGNILINTGLASSADPIRKNIRSLGFNIADTRVLLNTQAHYDHMGAMAKIKKWTGAKMMISEGDSAVVANGGKSDYLSGGSVSLFAPVKVDRVLHDGDSIVLGDAKLVMLSHPGHTKGSCSFILDTKDANRSYRVLIANIPTIITEKPFSQVTAYPAIAEDYAKTLAAMKSISFDVWVASHSGQFGLEEKHKPGSGYNPAAFIDRKGYDSLLADCEEKFQRQPK